MTIQVDHNQFHCIDRGLDHVPFDDHDRVIVCIRCGHILGLAEIPTPTRGTE